MHGGDIYSAKVKYDFSVNINSFYSSLKIYKSLLCSLNSAKNYPDPEAAELKKIISKTYTVKKEKIIIGNGASEIILSAVRAIMPSKALLISPCFSGYEHALNSVNAEIIYFSLDKAEDFLWTIEKKEEFKKLILKEKPQLLFLCNPNNPNGKLYSKNDFLDFINTCKESGTFVIADECFIELTGKAENFSLLKNLNECNNLLLINALTKTFSVPGLRTGFAFCSSDEMVLKIKKQQPEWNVSSIAQKTAAELFKDRKSFLNSAEKFSNERKFLSDNLVQLGFKVFPSDANFLLFYSEKEKLLKEKLLNKKILIRDCSDYKNLEKGFYRIAVKNRRQNKILLTAIKNILEK